MLVVIQLSGGNDGLNTVVPFEDDVYARSRPTLRLARTGLHRIAPGLAFHARMTGFKRMLDAGQLAIVQGVGYPEQDGDHDRARRVWHTAAPDPERFDTGWLGRATDDLWTGMQPLAPTAFVSPIPPPLAVNAATTVVPVLRKAQDAVAFEGPHGRGGPLPTVLQATVGNENPLLSHLLAANTAAAGQRERLAAVLGAESTSTTFPDHPFAQDLRTIARLIRAELGCRIFFTELGGGGIGGFDNHANQLGNHCALLQQLADSVAAFAADLAADRLLDEVLVLTFSEFGRTVAENGRRGTDHGAAGPMFLIGGALNPGVHGPHPSLTDLQGGGLKHHTDFRAVYASVLERWLGLPAGDILGDVFTPLELFRQA